MGKKVGDLYKFQGILFLKSSPSPLLLLHLQFSSQLWSLQLSVTIQHQCKTLVLYVFELLARAVFQQYCMVQPRSSLLSAHVFPHKLFCETYENNFVFCGCNMFTCFQVFMLMINTIIFINFVMWSETFLIPTTELNIISNSCLPTRRVLVNYVSSMIRIGLNNCSIFWKQR